MEELLVRERPRQQATDETPVIADEHASAQTMPKVIPDDRPEQEKPLPSYTIAPEEWLRLPHALMVESILQEFETQARLEESQSKKHEPQNLVDTRDPKEALAIDDRETVTAPQSKASSISTEGAKANLPVETSVDSAVQEARLAATLERLHQAALTVASKGESSEITAPKTNLEKIAAAFPHFGDVRLIETTAIAEIFEVTDKQNGQPLVLKYPNEEIDIAKLLLMLEQKFIQSLNEPRYFPRTERCIDLKHALYGISQEKLKPLDQYITERSLNVAERLRLANNVIEIVAFLHSKGVVHNDIKLQNFGVAQDGSVKMLDLKGCLKQIDAATLLSSLLHSGTVEGLERRLTQQTKIFLAPEVLAGGGAYQTIRCLRAWTGSL